MIKFTCDECGTGFKLADSAAGQKGKCPRCGAAIEVPVASMAATFEELQPPVVDDAPAYAVNEMAQDDEEAIPLGADPMADEEMEPSSEPQAPPVVQTASGLVITNIQDIALVHFEASSILDAPIISAIGSELYVLVEQQAFRKIVLDFSQVKFMSSQMLGVLISLHKKSAAIKGRVVLCGLRPDLMKVFSIMKLEKLLTIVGGESEAFRLLGHRNIA